MQQDSVETRRARLLRKQLYLVHMRPKVPLDDPLALLTPHMAAHLDFLRDLESRGVLFMSGALRDGNSWEGGGMAIIRAGSVAEAWEIARAEPFHVAGVRVNTVEGWQLNEGSLNFTLRIMERGFDIG